MPCPHNLPNIVIATIVVVVVVVVTAVVAIVVVVIAIVAVVVLWCSHGKVVDKGVESVDMLVMHD